MEDEQKYVKFDNKDYELADIIAYEENNYAIFLPVGEDAEGAVEIVKVIETTEDEEAEIYNAVYEIFKEANKDKYNFE